MTDSLHTVLLALADKWHELGNGPYVDDCVRELRAALAVEKPARKMDGYGQCSPPCGCPNCVRPRKLAQMLIGAIGSVGPESAEDTVARAVSDLEHLIAMESR